MKTFKQLSDTLSEATMDEGPLKRKEWIVTQIEKTDKPHDEIKSDFIERYGHGKSAREKAKLAQYFDKIVHEVVD